MLDRSSIKALIYFILISEVKEMKSDILQATNASFKKNFDLKLSFNNFQKRKSP
jgi:hypothetical protein